jgi:hypothetical protein
MKTGKKKEMRNNIKKDNAGKEKRLERELNDTLYRAIDGNKI